MRCEKCGHEFESGIVYCPKCGQSIQLVPDYNVLEEELLSSIVEDKNKSKDKFAQGVYNNPTEQKNSTSCSSKNTSSLFFKQKKFFISMASVFVIVAIGIIFIARYSYTHTFDYYIKSALEAENQSKFGLAKTNFEKAVNIDSNSFEAIFGLGRAYYLVKDYENAIVILNEALNLDDDNYEVYKYLLDCYKATSDLDSILEIAQNSPSDEITTLIGEYIILPPTFSEPAGNYDDYIQLYLISNTDNQIFYTDNGKDPTKSGKKYKGYIEIKSGETTIKAVCKNPEGKYSQVVTATYNIDYNGPGKPVVYPEGGSYDEPTMITIDVPSNVQAYYTWDASMPDTNSFLYTGPINVIPGKHILTVVYIDFHGNKGEIYRAQYDYN